MVRASNWSSEGCGFNPCLGLINHFLSIELEDRSSTLKNLLIFNYMATMFTWRSYTTVPVRCFDSQLTHEGKRAHFSILFWQMPDDFTCQRDEPWVLKIKVQPIWQPQYPNVDLPHLSNTLSWNQTANSAPGEAGRTGYPHL